MTADELKRCRHTLGLTQSELARLLRLAENGARSIRHYESGKRKVPGPISVVLDMLCNDYEPMDEFYPPAKLTWEDREWVKKTVKGIVRDA